ncbi:nocobactin polyketide synthase NbtC [Nocardia mexicana]|uniref:Mycobactin polyketide synthetase MbtD n=1 Tax=Nocardia mexicana TaxID=279262 RepID=A0A370GS73_9NOCA|nr:nocobactin polyketide synthase NbtC [Nocardia mexicana]RDI46170.1 mycobactin polyketide synthetase MbtD [Nocardia mexicana]
MSSHRLPDGSVPVLLSSDGPELLRAEAAAILGYLEQRPAVTPGQVADMLLRTRSARRHRVLAMVTERIELLEALRAIAAGDPHPAVIAGGPAIPRRIGYVFPGQGSQRAGMGLSFYEHSAAFRAAVDECEAVFQELYELSPLSYLLGRGEHDENVLRIVQPALFMQMLGLAAMWRAAGVEPAVTIGHSQGEIAAAVVSGVIPLADAVRVVTMRGGLVDTIASQNGMEGKYSMAVVGADRDECEALLARRSGWAEVSVINSAHVLALGGDRDVVSDIVTMLTENGKFAKEIRVPYPAHTTVVSEFRDRFCDDALIRDLDQPHFAATEIDCLGATLGAPITPDLPVGDYWYWNLRNRVRFDLAIAAAAAREVDTFLEIADHPALMLAIGENLSGVTPQRDFLTVGTSRRTADDLSEFTRNLATVAVSDANYRWDALRDSASGGAPTLPLPDFPNTQMNAKPLWAFSHPANGHTAVAAPTGVEAAPQQRGATAVSPGTAARTATAAAEPAVPSETVQPGDAPQPDSVPQPVPEAGTAVPQRLVEHWTRLQRRALVPPRTMALVDHTGRCADLVSAVCAVAPRHGATVVYTDESGAPTAPFDTLVVLVPPPSDTEIGAAVDDLAEFLGDRSWLRDTRGITDVWLVTTGGEQVLETDVPGLFHAAAQAGFRCLAAEHVGVGFRHIDLDPAADPDTSAKALAGALHIAGEPELAVRDGGVYAKRLVVDDTAEDRPLGAQDLREVVIVGGTGKLGLDLCEYFTEHGANRITLISRSGGDAAAVQRIRNLRRVGKAEIVVRNCDVGDETAVRALADDYRGTPATLIVHAAVDYSAAAADPTPDALRAAAASKAVALDHLVRHFPLAADGRIVLCSSLSATLGGRGHLAYSAVNRLLDAAAGRYRAGGLRCSSVQWGLWRAVGADHADALARISGAGLLPMDPASAVAAAFPPEPANILVTASDWGRIRELYSVFGYERLFAELPEESPQVVAAVPADTAVAPVLPETNGNSAVAPANSHEMAVAAPADTAETVRHALRTVMGLGGAEAIDGSVPLVALGLDSLQALDLRKRIESDLKRDLPVTAILGGASLDEVVSLLN